MSQKTGGQSVIEYLLLFTCVVATLIIFLGPNGPMKSVIEGRMNGVVDQLNGVIKNISF